MVVEETYKNDMQLKIEETQKETEQIQNQLQNEDQNILKKFLSTITGGATGLVKTFEEKLNNFIEAISVMLITACVIPILTFMVLLWLLRSILQIDIKTPDFYELARKTRIDPYRIAGRIHGRKEIE